MIYLITVFFCLNIVSIFGKVPDKEYSLYRNITNFNNFSEDNEKLHVIVVFENPCSYSKRTALTKIFFKKMDQNQAVFTYVIELCYSKQQSSIIDKNNPRHLLLNTNTAYMWHKENLINIAVKKLLPKSWKSFAWIDSDIEFDNPSWALNALELLNRSKDVVQLFGEALSYNKNSTYEIQPGFVFQKMLKNKQKTFSRTGLAWAISKKAYLTLGKFLDYLILGSGDKIFAFALFNSSKISDFLPSGFNKNFINMILLFQEKASKLKVGYVPGIIKHFYHGSKKNRQYYNRYKILIRHKYDPKKHLFELENGLLVPSKSCPRRLLRDIHNYFKQRNEDD